MNKHFRVTTRINRHTKVDAPETVLGFRWVTKPIYCQVELTIDVERLANHLGSRAMGNRSRRARLADGMIDCSVTELEAANG